MSWMKKHEKCFSVRSSFPFLFSLKRRKRAIYTVFLSSDQKNFQLSAESNINEEYNTGSSIEQSAKLESQCFD